MLWLVGAPFGLGGALRWSRTIFDGVRYGAGISTGLGSGWLGWWAERGIGIVQGDC